MRLVTRVALVAALQIKQGTIIAGASGTSGQGNDGGYCYDSGSSSSGGGGGGAGGDGGDGASQAGGSRGAGVNNSITGTSTLYAQGGEGGDNTGDALAVERLRQGRCVYWRRRRWRQKRH